MTPRQPRPARSSAASGGSGRPGRRGRARSADAAAVLALLALPWLLYGSALDLWWTHDDLFQLRFTADHGPAGYVFDPDTQDRLPNKVLSPLLFASYDLDLALGGLEPVVFYAHQLLSLAAAALALYLLLRLWTGAAWAFLGGALFLLGPPVAAAAPLLMVRHYPEALALALLAAAAFTAAARRHRAPSWTSAWIMAGLSAGLYLAASLAKEIAVPLPLVLACLPSGRLRRRLLLLTPHAVVLALYAAYRAWMLGTPLGGYGWVPHPDERWEVLAALPGRIVREMSGGSLWGWGAVGLLGLAILLLGAAGRRNAALLGSGAAAAVLPFAPVAFEVHARYALAAWLLLAAALPLAARRLARTAPGAGGPGGPRTAAVAGAGALVALVAGCAFAAGRTAWAEHHRQAARMSAQNQGFLALGPGASLRHPLGPPATMAELRRFARDLLGQPAEAGWFYDDLVLCRRGAGDEERLRSVWQLDPDAPRLRNITEDVPRIRRDHCGAIRWHAPLEATFAWDGRVLSWELGPRRDGDYAFVLDGGRVRHHAPRAGAFRLPRLALPGLRIRYDAPEGWTTYSPPLRIAPEPGEPMHWQRPPPTPAGRELGRFTPSSSPGSRASRSAPREEASSAPKR